MKVWTWYDRSSTEEPSLWKCFRADSWPDWAGSLERRRPHPKWDEVSWAFPCEPRLYPGGHQIFAAGWHYRGPQRPRDLCGAQCAAKNTWWAPGWYAQQCRVLRWCAPVPVYHRVLYHSSGLPDLYTGGYRPSAWELPANDGLWGEEGSPRVRSLRNRISCLYRRNAEKWGPFSSV